LLLDDALWTARGITLTGSWARTEAPRKFANSVLNFEQKEPTLAIEFCDSTTFDKGRVTLVALTEDHLTVRWPWRRWGDAVFDLQGGIMVEKGHIMWQRMARSGGSGRDKK